MPDAERVEETHKIEVQVEGVRYYWQAGSWFEERKYGYDPVTDGDTIDFLNHIRTLQAERDSLRRVVQASDMLPDLIGHCDFWPASAYNAIRAFYAELTRHNTEHPEG